MIRKSNVIQIFIFVASFASDANAYIDPGSNLLIIQGLLSLIAGFVVFVRNPIQVTRDFLKKIFVRKIKK